MKKHFLKSFALLAMLFSALTLSAQSGVDWSTYEFLGDGAGGGKYTNKYKMSAAEGLSVVNIQQPGFTDQPSIYATVPAGISDCNVSSTIQGAGIALHLSAFTAKETQVTINYAGGSCTFWVYYADGTEGGGEGGETPDPTPEPEPGVIDWSSIAWLGNGSGLPENTDKYKISQNCLNEVVNIQKPGWADEPGIYVVAPGAIESCSVNGAIQGGGMVLYLSSFTAKETEVTINYAGGSCTFWVYYADGTEGGGEGGEEPEPTPDPEETIITYTYFAPNWQPETNSSATYNPETGAITVDLKNQFYGQWQAQVKVKHDVAFSADKQYTLSCKFHATAAVGGVTIKMDDNQDNPVLFENASLSLPANEDYVYTSAPSNGIAGNNQILVFDFGWAPVCQITISDITIQEVVPTEPEEPGDKWASVDWVADSDNKYKVLHECLSSVVNVQQPPWAAEKGIYVTVPAGISDCSVNGAIDGAGMILYLSSFTAKETEVTITHGLGTCTFWVYYADGTEGTEGGEEPDPTPTEVYDVNFALASNGSSAEATSGDAAAAIDNNTGTRWESAQEDPQTWILDLGQLRIFNTLEIVWEGAYAKTFTVSTSSDKTNWTPVWQVTGQALAGFPYTQTQTIDKTTARYVKFEGIERGTGYGYSFWEFRVYLAGVSTLTTLEAKPTADLTKVGEGLTINIAPKDQNGQVMTDAGEVIYTITPADAGTITNNIYTPAKIGSASIVATIGEVSAPAFEVFAYDGENVALSPDINNSKIVAQSDFAPSGTDAWHAIDGNEGSVWQGSATNGTADDEAARTFDAWFVVDFGAYYDINLVSINFEGACSQEYHVDFSADNATWNQAYNYVGTANTNAHTQLIYGNDLQNSTKVRYARFYSTKAATKWGMKIYEFKVFGTPFVASGDTEKPVMGTATLVSNTYKSAIIAVSATDNDEVASYHVVCTNPAYEQTLSPTDGKITLNNLTPATTYNFTITAIDLAGNESENAATVSFTTDVYNLKPTAAPAAPTHEPNKVQSVFCDVYGGTFSAMEGWGQSTQFEELNFDGNYVRYYTNFNYLGWQTATPINAFAMEKLHLDIWASDNATLDIVPIYGGPGLTTDDGQIKKVTLIGQQWNSIEFDLATDFPNLNLNSIFQFKFFNPSGAAIFAFDNVYFYRESEIGDATPPTNLTATAVPAFETAVISCQATDESGSISYKVYLGAELKGTGSANSGETVAITVTNLQPNRKFTMTVIATDVYGNESAETVDVNFTTLAYPSPAPTPMWADNNVKSIYSESYAPAFTSLNSYNEGWWNAPQMLDAAITNDNHALYYYGFTDGMIGWQFAAFDATGCTTFTMDIYPMNDGTIDFGPLGEGENDYAITNIPVKGGQWNTITVDLRDKDLTKIFQVKMINYYSLGAFFIDNVYLYKEVHQEVTGSLEIIEDYAYNSLTITEGGKVTISNSAKLIVKDFVIQSTMGAGESGQLVGATLSNFDVIGDAYIDITLGKDAAADQWHAFTVPFPVDAMNGVYDLNDNKLTNEVNYAIMDYHGDIRANGQYGWKKYRGILVPGTFYLITVDGARTTYRFKKVKDAELIAPATKELKAYTGTGESTDFGWNGVGNPTLMYGKVAFDAQILDPVSYAYVPVPASSAHFTVGTPFFIQAAADATVTIAAEVSGSLAPARRAAATVDKVKVMLGNADYTDYLYVSASEDATNEYEIGKDLAKMTMTNTPSVPQIFAEAYNTSLCMIDAPMANNEAVVALNLYAPADGEYTLSAEAQNGETIYLLKDNAIVWDLTASEYTIDLSQGNTEVYGVAIKRAPQVETGVNDGATIQTLPSKVILQGNLYILHNGQVYDAMGKCVK